MSSWMPPRAGWRPALALWPVLALCLPLAARAQVCFRVESGYLTAGSGCPQVGDLVCKIDFSVCEQTRVAIIGLCACSSGLRCNGEIHPDPVLGPCAATGTAADAYAFPPQQGATARGEPLQPSTAATYLRNVASETEQRQAALFPPKPRLVPTPHLSDPSFDSIWRHHSTGFQEGMAERARRQVQAWHCAAADQAYQDLVGEARAFQGEARLAAGQVALAEPLGKLGHELKEGARDLATVDAAAIGYPNAAPAIYQGVDLARRIQGYQEKLRKWREGEYARALQELEAVSHCLVTASCTMKDYDAINAALARFLKKLDAIEAAVERASEGGKVVSDFARRLLEGNARLATETARCLGEP